MKMKGDERATLPWDTAASPLCGLRAVMRLRNLARGRERLDTPRVSVITASQSELRVSFVNFGSYLILSSEETGPLLSWSHAWAAGLT